MSVHSKAGKTWLTKLARIGEVSATDAKIVFNNLGHILDAGTLKEQYHKLDAKKATGIDGMTKQAYGETWMKISIISSNGFVGELINLNPRE